LPASPSSPPRFSISKPAIDCEATMIDLVLGGITSLLILAYLVYALLRPERF
jgi:K+-transporting ATPase KdpF subunit